MTTADDRIHRFSEFELDEARRELRLAGREIVLQPRVFDVLRYLVRHRGRTVSKAELLEKLWSDAVVTESSVERAISLIRSVLRERGLGTAIRTYARRGYRFELEVESVAPSRAPMTPEVERARRAYETGQWIDAVNGFRAADALEALKGPDLERWAQAARCSGEPQEAIAALERALAAHGAVGDRRGMARCAVLLGVIQLDRMESAVARGWCERARSLLSTDPRCRESGLCEVLASRVSVFEGRLEEAAERAERACSIGRELQDADLEVMGLSYHGLALLGLGEIERGIAFQDEAAAAVLGGGVSFWAGGMVYCGVIFGCRNRSDWDRASQWTEQFTRWCYGNGPPSFPSTCRLHRAEVLGIRGEIEEAEHELEEAIQMLSTAAPWAVGDAWRVLGDLRLAQGDLDGADSAFRRARELGWDPQPGLAFLQEERGDIELALRGLERALEDPSWVNRQRRIVLLTSLATLAARAGRSERAREAMEEVERHESVLATPAIAARVARARAEMAVAEGRLGRAVGELRHAARVWQRIGSPLELAALRARAAEVLADDGDFDAADVEVRAAERLFAELDAPARVVACRRLHERLQGKASS